MSKQTNKLEVVASTSDTLEHGAEIVKKQGLSVRAVIISLLFVTVISVVTTISKVYRTIPTPDAYYMRLNPIALGVVVAVIAFNMLLRKINTRFAFTGSELVTIYGMTFVGGLVVQSGYFLYWVFSMAVDSREYYLMMKSDFGQWVEKLSPLVGIKDQDVATSFWFGGEQVKWAYWIGPILMWALFLGVLYFVMLCMFTLVRKHWNEHEHLQYPVAQAVLLVSAPEKTTMVQHSEKSVWFNSLLRIGFAIAFVLTSLTALNSHYPMIPAFPVDIFTFHEIFTNEPWHTAFMVFPPVFFRMRPLLIGIGYLISVEITLSIWFFYVLSRFVILPVQGSMGMIASGNNQYLFNDIQGMGALVALVGLSLWMARENIKSTFAAAIHGTDHEPDEILSPRVAVFGGICGLVFLVVFANVFLFASFPIAFLWFVYFYITAFGLGRIRAQAGLPMQSATREPILVLFGSSNLSGGSIYFLGKMEPLGGERYFPSIAQDTMDQYKMAEQVGMKRRSMTWALMIAVLFGAIASMIIGLPMISDKGGFMFDQHFATNMQRHTNWIWSWAESFKESSVVSIGYFLVGVVGTLIVGALHSSFMWWPLHPIGFAISSFMRMHDIWSSFLIAWMIKTLVMRWGGPALERKIAPVFLGLIIGTALGETFWLLANLVAFA